MSAWWQALPIEMQVFYGIAIVATTVLVFQTLLMLVGFGDDMHVGDVDMSSAGHHAAGLSLVSSHHHRLPRWFRLDRSRRA